MISAPWCCYRYMVSPKDGKDEPTSPTSPLARFPPLPPAESRSRAPEFYGFVAWAVTYLVFILYFLWAILPDKWIIRLGVTWYPNRYVGSEMEMFLLSLVR
jgi:hypothetical protein